MLLTIATNYVKIKYPEYDVIDIADQTNRSDLLFFLFIRFLNAPLLAVGIPLIPSPRWERVRERGIKIAFFLFIPRSLAAG